jgi:hypothetical protein
MLRPNQLVAFRSDYNGYFKHLIGLTFQVDRVIPADRKSGESERVTLLEIDEIHLISSRWLVSVNSEVKHGAA